VIRNRKKLVDENDSGSLRLSAQQLLNRFERIRNALDRDADGYLYGDHDYARAQAGYRECLAFLGKHWLDDGPKAIQAAITRCKLAMGAGLLGSRRCRRSPGRADSGR